jgi:hypothetical protein
MTPTRFVCTPNRDIRKAALDAGMLLCDGVQDPPAALGKLGLQQWRQWSMIVAWEFCSAGRLAFWPLVPCEGEQWPDASRQADASLSRSRLQL